MKYTYGALAVLLSLSDLTWTRLEHSVDPGFVFSWNKCRTRFGLFFLNRAFVHYCVLSIIYKLCYIKTCLQVLAKPFKRSQIYFTLMSQPFLNIIMSVEKKLKRISWLMLSTKEFQNYYNFTVSVATSFNFTIKMREIHSSVILRQYSWLLILPFFTLAKFSSLFINFFTQILPLHVNRVRYVINFNVRSFRFGN